MKFYIDYQKNKTILTAEAESNAEMIGNCDLEPYFPVKMGYRTIHVEFHWTVNDLMMQEPHPDLIALACLALFYPFCHGKVTFPKPVSRHLAEALMKFPVRRKINNQYREIGGKITVTQLDPYLPKFSGQYKGAEFDADVRTTALKSMYPELWLVHQYSDLVKKEEAGEKESLRNGTRIMEFWGQDNKFIPVKVTNLIRFTPMACLASTLLLSSVLNLRTLVYSPDRSKGEIRVLDEGLSLSLGDWENLFMNACGITVVNYMKGLSILTCTSLAYQGGLLSQVMFCRRGKDEKECLKCFECFRHLVYFAFLDVMEVVSSDWQKFNTNELKRNIIRLNDPEVNYCLRELHRKGRLPNWLVPFATFPGARLMQNYGQYDLTCLRGDLDTKNRNELILRLKTYGISVVK
jgi:hypothetical protein